MVYCWRGGQRSGSVATILTQIGWRTETITGGYQAYRRLVHAALYDTPLPHRIILLDGNTGTAKTEILPALPHAACRSSTSRGWRGIAALSSAVLPVVSHRNAPLNPASPWR